MLSDTCVAYGLSGSMGRVSQGDPLQEGDGVCARDAPLLPHKEQMPQSSLSIT